jgi:hypothetical protein
VLLLLQRDAGYAGRKRDYSAMMQDNRCAEMCKAAQGAPQLPLLLPIACGKAACVDASAFTSLAVQYAVHLVQGCR